MRNKKLKRPWCPALIRTVERRYRLEQDVALARDALHEEDGGDHRTGQHSRDSRKWDDIRQTEADVIVVFIDCTRQSNKNVTETIDCARRGKHTDTSGGETSTSEFATNSTENRVRQTSRRVSGMSEGDKAR